MVNNVFPSNSSRVTLSLARVKHSMMCFFTSSLSHFSEKQTRYSPAAILVCAPWSWDGRQPMSLFLLPKVTLRPSLPSSTLAKRSSHTLPRVAFSLQVLSYFLAVIKATCAASTHLIYTYDIPFLFLCLCACCSCFCFHSFQGGGEWGKIGCRSSSFHGYGVVNFS